MLYNKLIEREKNTGQSAPECPFNRQIFCIFFCTVTLVNNMMTLIIAISWHNT